MNENIISNANVNKTFKLSEIKMKNEKRKVIIIINIAIFILFIMKISISHINDYHSNLIFLMAFILVNFLLLNFKNPNIELNLTDDELIYKDSNLIFKARYNEIEAIEIKKKINNSIFSFNLRFKNGILCITQQLENIEEIMEIITSKAKALKPEITIKNSSYFNILDTITSLLLIIGLSLYLTPYTIYINKIFGILMINGGYSILVQKPFSSSVIPAISLKYEMALGIFAIIMGLGSLIA